MWPLRSHSEEGTIFRDAHRSPDVLAILESSRDQTTVAEFATNSHWDLTVVPTLDQGFLLAAEKIVAIILLDRELAGSEWRSTVHRFAQHQPKPCIILASSVMDPYLFDEFVRQGGYDVVAKPLQADELRRIGHLAFTFWKNRRAGKWTR